MLRTQDFNGPYASQNDTSGFGVNFTSYDNIALSSRTTLTSVEWIGGYYSPQRAGSTLGLDNIDDPVFLYGAAVNFTAGAGTQYWLSVARGTAFPPQWGWTSSSQGDGVPYTDDPFGNRTQDFTDLSFALFKQQPSTTPEPRSLMPLGSGEVGVAGMLRRRIRA